MMPSTWSWHWPQIDVAVTVDATTASIFEAARQQWYQCERGGQLFANLSYPGGVSLIATPPHQADDSGQAWLELDKVRCQLEIAEANGRGLRLVGYWHTHPQRIPELSPKDIASFKAFSLRHRETLPHPVAVIVGTAKTPESVRAWSIRPEGLQEGIRQDEETTP